jgi:iron complex outermembrane recepter protein
MPPTQVPFRPCRPTRVGRWLALLCALLWAKLPAAEEAARRRYDIPAGSAVVTLKRAAHQGGLEIVYSAAVVEGVQTQPVAGEFTPREALERMVAQTPLKIFQDPQTGALSIIRRPDAKSVQTPSPAPPPRMNRNPEHPFPMKRKNPIAILGTWLALALAPGQTAPAADGSSSTFAQTGSIAGRVQNVVTGNYLNKARVAVKGSDVVVYTDEFGLYRLVNVRSGPIVLEVFYTDLDPQEIAVQVPAGGSIEQNAELTSKTRYGTGTAIVKLDPFVVSQDKETDGKAIAINEQRFAPNIKNVLSSDSFGDVLGSNVGEFLKFVPGLTAEYSEVEIVGISVRGLGNDKTAFTSDGASVVSAAGGAATRTFNLAVLSLNNISRVEVTKVPTPASPADAMGGSVNMVTKSAFERTRAQFNYGVGLVANSENLTFKKTPHANGDHNTRKILPGWDFDYIQPIGKNFGLTLTGFQSDKFNEQHSTRMLYNAGGTSTGASFSQPYLQQHTLLDGPRSQRRTGFSLRADWRVTPNSVLSFGAQTNQFVVYIGTQNWVTNAGTVGTSSIPGGVPLSYGENFTVGATGRGAVTNTSGGQTFKGDTDAGNLSYRFDNGRWQIESGVNMSRSTRSRPDPGHFSNISSALINPVRISFLDANADQPGAIKVYDNTNREVDIYDLKNYRLNTATTAPYDTASVFKSANLNLKRRFRIFSFPFALQAGGLQTRMRVDTRLGGGTYSYNGPDGNPTTPDTPEPFLMQVYKNQDNFYGFKNIPWPSVNRAYSAHAANPGLFTQTLAQAVAEESARLTNSEYIEEKVSAYYVQAEARLLNNRLNLLSGVRFEKTTDKGEGSLFNADAVFVRNPNGTFAHTAAGARIRKPEAGAAGSMEELRLTRRERAFKNERSYAGYFPSLHLTYNIRENFQARAAYARTYGRPNFTDIIPNATFSERDLTEGDLNNPEIVRGTVTIRNTALKPWSADNYDLSLEYYTQSGGILSGGLFRKEIKDFFGSAVKVAKLEDLAAVGLDARYVNWNLSTKFNAGSARVSGVEINFRQSLRMLGAWGNHFAVFGNGTKLQLQGQNQADFSSFIPKSANGGISFSRKQITLVAKWNYRGLDKRAAQPAFGPEGYLYFAARTQLDLNAAYQLNRKFSLNVSVSNALNVPQTMLIYGSQTPAYARQSRESEYGIALAVGLKGSF